MKNLNGGTATPYRKIFDIVDDLRFFLKHQDYSLLDQLIFYLEQVRKDSDERQQLARYDSLLSIVKNTIVDYLSQVLTSKEDITSLNVLLTDREYLLHDFEYSLKILPSVLQVIEKLPFTQHLNIRFENNRIAIEGAILSEKLPSYADLLAISQKFFKLHILPTWEYRDGIAHLTFNLGHNPQQIYCVPLEKMTLYFSNLLAAYTVESSMWGHYREYPLLAITSSLDVQFSPAHTWLRPPSGQLLYFPFLHSPLCILLPQKGEICDYNKLEDAAFADFFLDIFAILTATEAR